MIGVDTVRISRIEKAIKNPSFVTGVFTKAEREYCDGKAKPQESYSGIFCAKEAAVKALKCGFGTGIMPIDIEVLHGENGEPVLHFVSENAIKMLEGRTADLSISHDGDYAVAVVAID